MKGMSVKVKLVKVNSVTLLRQLSDTLAKEHLIKKTVSLKTSSLQTFLTENQGRKSRNEP